MQINLVEFNIKSKVIEISASGNVLDFSRSLKTDYFSRPNKDIEI